MTIRVLLVEDEPLALRRLRAGTRSYGCSAANDHPGLTPRCSSDVDIHNCRPQH